MAKSMWSLLKCAGVTTEKNKLYNQRENLKLLRDVKPKQRPQAKGTIIKSYYTEITPTREESHLGPRVDTSCCLKSKYTQ